MPKFQLSGRFDLDKILPELGIKDLFNERADLSGISDSPHLDLSLSNFVHETGIEVVEEGFDPPAGTTVVTEKQPIEQFNMDRPFLFLIQDSRTDLVLFMGRLMNPEL